MNKNGNKEIELEDFRGALQKLQPTHDGATAVDAVEIDKVGYSRDERRLFDTQKRAQIGEIIRLPIW